MPTVTIDMYEGRSSEQKRELVKEITGAVTRICKVEPVAVTIIIHDLPKSNIAKSGILGCDQEER